MQFLNQGFFFRQLGVCQLLFWIRLIWYGSCRWLICGRQVVWLGMLWCFWQVCIIILLIMFLSWLIVVGLVLLFQLSNLVMFKWYLWGRCWCRLWRKLMYLLRQWVCVLKLIWMLIIGLLVCFQCCIWFSMVWQICGVQCRVWVWYIIQILFCVRCGIEMFWVISCMFLLGCWCDWLICFCRMYSVLVCVSIGCGVMLFYSQKVLQFLVCIVVLMDGNSGRFSNRFVSQVCQCFISSILVFWFRSCWCRLI